jgi:hypothetical protein
METLKPREAALRDQFRQKLVELIKKCILRGRPIAAGKDPRLLSERNFVRRIIQDAILETIPLSATYSFEAKRYHYGFHRLRTCFVSYTLLGPLRGRRRYGINRKRGSQCPVSTLLTAFESAQ